MSRLRRTTGAVLLTAVLCLGTTAGPASADSAADVGAHEPAAAVAVESPPAEQAAEQPAAEQPPAEPAITQPAEPVPAEPVPAAPAPPGTTTTDQAAVPAELPDLRLTVTFDKTSYRRDETVVATARVVNAGAATATWVKVRSTGNVTNHIWEGLPWTGATLEPGQTGEAVLTGRVADSADSLTLDVTVASQEQDAVPADNAVTATVPVTTAYGTLTGVVYGDRDGDSAMDSGEALAGLQVIAGTVFPPMTVSATTDAAGRFAFPRLPIGEYSVRFDTEDWGFKPLTAVVAEGDNPEAEFRGMPVVDGVLSISSEFAQPTYAVGDTAHLLLHVTNNGEAPVLTGVGNCQAVGATFLDFDGLDVPGGAPIAGRSTRTLDVTLRVEQTAFTSGYLDAYCWWGAPSHVIGQIYTNAVTRVPGGHAPLVTGVAGYYGARPCVRCPVPFVPLPGLKVYLRNQVTGQVVARATTDGSGSFAFRDVPADRYTFGVVGPWRALLSLVAQDGENGNHKHEMVLVPAPDQPDPDAPTPPGDGTPPGDAPAPRGAGGAAAKTLAKTGAELGWLVLGGLLTLVLGVGLVLRGRRPV